MDSPFCVAEVTGTGSCVGLFVFSDPLQQGPAGSQVCQCGNQNWRRGSNKLGSKPLEGTIAGCLVTPACSTDAGMREEFPPVSPLYLSESQGREWEWQLVSGTLWCMV